MVATASPVGGPLSERQIYGLLAEAEVYARRFTKAEDSERLDIMVFNAKDLERAWDTSSTWPTMRP